MAEERRKAGSGEAWQSLVDLYYRPVFHFAWAMLADRQEAEDVVQEVFLKAHQHLSIGEENRDSTELKAWLYAAARNACLDRHRRWKRWLKILGALRHRPSTVDAEDPAALMLKIVQRLSPRQRQVLVLRQWHGFSIEETAKLLGIGEGSVKSHLSRAVETVKLRLKKDGII